MSNVFPRVSFRGSFRSYQQEILDEAERYIADGHLHIVAAPGSGKTVLGLELIRRVGKPTLILSPTVTVRDQWGERFAELFLPDGEALSDYVGNDLGRCKPICSITYQALHAASHPDESGAPRWAALIRQMGIGTVCLDEAHHLRSEWQRSLEALLDALGDDVAVIALTATPPYDSTAAEWERYLRVCGPIDAEIFVPELVKRKTLCPHQDYIYFSYPTEGESDMLEHYAQRADAALQALQREGLLARAVQVLERGEDGARESLWENADDYVALLSLADAFGVALSKETVRLLLPSSHLPVCREEVAERALGFVSSRGDLFGAELSGRVKQILEEAGLCQGGTLSLTADSSLQRKMLSSLGKLDSIARIAESEIASCARGLRMLILTDHIRQNLLGLINTDAPLSAMGAVPIFETVRRVCPYEIRLALLTGTLVIVPNAALGDLLSLAAERGISCGVSPLGESRYSVLTAQGGSRDAVALLTAAFERGILHILVGTKALLGEGWDSPCVNTLVLASFIGSFMSSNQMRGRAIRIDRSDPKKAANIWHLVTLLPPERKLSFLCSDDERPLGEDYALLRRRFACFMAPSYDGKRIESGIERIDLLRPPYTRERIAAINADMLARSADRRGMAESWEHALADHAEAKVRETVRSARSIRPRAYSAGAGGAAALHGVLAAAAGAVCLASPPVAAYCVLLPLMGYSAFSMIGDLRRSLGNASAEKSVRRLGEALLRTLRLSGQIASQNAAVCVEKRGDGVECAIENASEREKSLFAEAMGELLSPIDNPRYLLIRLLPLFGFSRRLVAQSYACPTLLGAKKETAELFQKELEKSGDNFELVYTRSPEGRRLLLSCRLAANEGREQAKVTRARSLGGK